MTENAYATPAKTLLSGVIFPLPPLAADLAALMPLIAAGQARLGSAPHALLSFQEHQHVLYCSMLLDFNLGISSSGEVKKCSLQSKLTKSCMPTVKNTKGDVLGDRPSAGLSALKLQGTPYSRQAAAQSKQHDTESIQAMAAEAKRPAQSINSHRTESMKIIGWLTQLSQQPEHWRQLPRPAFIDGQIHQHAVLKMGTGLITTRPRQRAPKPQHLAGSHQGNLLAGRTQGCGGSTSAALAGPIPPSTSIQGLTPSSLHICLRRAILLICD